MAQPLEDERTLFVEGLAIPQGFGGPSHAKGRRRTCQSPSSQLRRAGLDCLRHTTSVVARIGRGTYGWGSQTRRIGNSGRPSGPGSPLRPQRSRRSSTTTTPAWCEAPPALVMQACMCVMTCPGCNSFAQAHCMLPRTLFVSCEVVLKVCLTCGLIQPSWRFNAAFLKSFPEGLIGQRHAHANWLHQAMRNLSL